MNAEAAGILALQSAFEADLAGGGQRMIVQATWEHAALLAPRMRAADRDEVWAAGRATPEVALEVSLRASSIAWSWIVLDEVLAMGGASPARERDGWAAPWMLGADGIADHPAAFLRMSLEQVAVMRRAYPVLANWTDARHMASHRWLRWLGFRLGEARSYGALGLPFIPFTMGVQ